MFWKLQLASRPSQAGSGAPSTLASARGPASHVLATRVQMHSRLHRSQMQARVAQGLVAIASEAECACFLEAWQRQACWSFAVIPREVMADSRMTPRLRDPMRQVPCRSVGCWLLGVSCLLLHCACTHQPCAWDAWRLLSCSGDRQARLLPASARQKCLPRSLSIAARISAADLTFAGVTCSALRLAYMPARMRPGTVLRRPAAPDRPQP